MTKIIKRKRKFSPNPIKYLRLHRSEYGQPFKARLNLDRFYPNVENVIIKIKSYFKTPVNSEIIVGLGAESIIKDIFIWHSQKNKRKNVLIYEPNYYMYEHFSTLFGYKVEKIRLHKDKNFFLNSKDIIDVSKKKNINLICLVNPSAPLEKQLNFNEVLKITRYAKKNNITVLLDEVYRNFSENQSIQYINRFNNLIIVKSFSKMVGYPGIRAGFAICKRDIFLELDSYRLSIEIPSYTVKKMTKILNNPKQIRKSEINVQKVLEYAKKELIKKKYEVYNQTINSILFEVKNNYQKKQILKKLIKNKILVNHNFKGDLKNCISFTTTSKANVKRLINLLDVQK